MHLYIFIHTHRSLRDGGEEEMDDDDGAPLFRCRTSDKPTQVTGVTDHYPEDFAGGTL